MKDMYNEIWRAIKGFEGLYEVSNLGRVKSIERTVVRKNGRKCYVRERMLKAGKDSVDYLTVNLYKNGVGQTYLVHRLVAEAFIPNPCPEKYDIVNHKIEGAEGKLINTVENLEWCDYDYNNNYGTHNERSAKARSRTVFQYTTTNELVKEWQSTREIQRQTGWSHSHIGKCCNGKLKTAYGYKWSYTVL